MIFIFASNFEFSTDEHIDVVGYIFEFGFCGLAYRSWSLGAVGFPAAVGGAALS
jgi:hypothetical protein